MTEITQDFNLKCYYCGPYSGWIEIELCDKGRKLINAQTCPKCAGKPHFKTGLTENENWTPQEKADINIPKRFANATVNTYIAKGAGQKKAKSIANQYIANFSKYLAKGAGGLIFSGGVGTGKTHLSISILKAVSDQDIKYKCRYVNVFDMVADIKATWNDNFSSEAKVVEKYCSYDLMVVDEIGVQYGSTAENVILFRILNQRYLENKPTILVSNLNEEELNELLGRAVIDRIHENGGGVLAFDWGSNRRKNN